MKWIGWPKQDDLWGSRRAGQMHGRGINRDEQTRVSEQCRKGEEIELRGKVEHRNVQFFPDSRKVSALNFIAAA